MKMFDLEEPVFAVIVLEGDPLDKAFGHLHFFAGVTRQADGRDHGVLKARPDMV